ncbi:MAG: nitroreductase [Rhodospirillales bacterium]|nr:nitroreductase [Rhodospirillales bacterium]
MVDYMAAWKVSEKDFPQDGTAAEKLAFCARYAQLTPSTYNTQPWLFSISGNKLFLYADRRYGLPVTDPDDRGLEIACGSALANLQLALRAFGYEQTTQLLPDPTDDDLMAIVTLGHKLDTPVEESDKGLFQVIAKRHMNWGSFSDKKVPDELLRALEQEAEKAGAWLHICAPHERGQIVHMVAEADHIQTGDKHFRRELLNWIHPRRLGSGDGIPSDSARYSAIMSSFSPHLLRRFEGEHNKAARDDQLDEGSPVIAVVGSMSGGTKSRLMAGMALMRVLLRAEEAGLAASTLNQPCEVPELRLRLHDALDRQGRAQFILRLGYGGKPVYTPRRPLSSVLTFEGKKAEDVEHILSGKSSNGMFGKFKRAFGAK